MTIDIINKNLHRKFIFLPDANLKNKDKLKEIFKKTFESQPYIFADGKESKVIDDIEIKDVNVLYVPFIRMKGSMDVDWSCVEILRDYNRNMDQYVSRTGKSSKEFDTLIPIANIKGGVYGELYAYRFSNIEFKSIKDVRFNELSENMSHLDFQVVPLVEDDEWLTAQIEKKMHHMATSISCNVNGITESEQECHKLTLDNGVTGLVYYLPTVSFKYRYHGKDLEWDFLLDSSLYYKPIRVSDYKYYEDVVAVRKTAELRKAVQEAEINEKKRIEDIKLVEEGIKRAEDFSFFKEQRNILLAVTVLCGILCFTWFIFGTWHIHDGYEITAFFFFSLAVCEFLVAIGSNVNTGLDKLCILDRIKDPSQDLISRGNRVKKKLQITTNLKWWIISICIILTILIPIHFG